MLQFGSLQRNASAAPAKRRRRPSVVVFALFFSLLVPLLFLFGRFPAGYVTDERPQQKISFPSYSDSESERESQEDALPGDDKIDKTFVPVLLKDNMGNSGIHSGEDLHKTSLNDSFGNNVIKSQTKDLSKPQGPPKTLPPPSVTNGEKDQMRRKRVKLLFSEETEKACQLEFGSYCLWSIEHREVMKDSIVKRIKDQLFMARAYYPSIAKIQGQEDLTGELKQCIQDHERVLSESIVDADLPPLIRKKIAEMEQIIARAKAYTVDCNNVDRKLRQILDLTEDEAQFHRKQSSFLYQLGVYTMPKSHHCLNMRLSVEYFKSPPLDPDPMDSHKFDIPKYRHYVLFSKSVLAASVTVNSTVMSSEVTGNMVFHVLTDAQNYYAMKLWFTRNSYGEAALRVINYEQLVLQEFPNLVSKQLFLSEEFRISIRETDNSDSKTRMEYLSVFSHSHFILPEILTNLKKVVLLDDDVVIQRDLSFLWNLDLGDKVNGAIQFCGVRLGQLRNYLGDNYIYDPNSCAWMSGVNVIDFKKWREHKLTKKYLQLSEQFQNVGQTSLRTSALPISLLAFQNLIYPLDQRLTLSALGYNYDIDTDAVTSAASLHYNGNMKPWLDLGIPYYKKYWHRFLTRGERFMDECNLHP